MNIRERIEEYRKTFDCSGEDDDVYQLAHAIAEGFALLAEVQLSSEEFWQARIWTARSPVRDEILDKGPSTRVPK